MQSKENGKTQASELEVDTSVGTAAARRKTVNSVFLLTSWER